MVSTLLQLNATYNVRNPELPIYVGIVVPHDSSAKQTLEARRQMNDIDFKKMMKEHALAGISY